MSSRQPNQALLYLRRSNSKQELSLQSQIQWAIPEAEKHGVRLDASLADLEEARRQNMSAYKAIRLDDAITGADLDRPGLQALIADAIADSSISHLFVYKRDRIGRPEDPCVLLMMEHQIRRAGVTIVTSEGVAPPLERGERDLAGDITHLVAYYESRQWLESHAERIIVAQQQLAREGFSTGRRPSYGFARFLVGRDGAVIEKLDPGRRVRQHECHVAILPDIDEPEKLAIRKLMLDLRRDGWGWKRIALHLNKLGIPSPAAGETRTDNGVRHRISGRWWPNTVASLCKDPLVVGILEYGRRAEGALRRQSPDGPQRLTDADRHADGRTRLRLNAESECIRTKVAGGNDPWYDPEAFAEIQHQIVERGRDQRGVTRSRDPARWPLSGILIDLTNGCGHPMYGRKHGQRAIQVCGRYWKTGGAECDNNTVDAEATLRFVLRTIRQLVYQHGDLSQLEKFLADRATRTRKQERATPILGIERRVAECEESLAVVRHRMARERDDDVYAGLTTEFQEISDDLRSAKNELVRERKRVASESDADAAVAGAKELLGSIEQVASDPTARAGINPLLRRLGVLVGLRFVAAVKGRKRCVRRLASGEMTFGGRPLSVPFYGRENAGSRENKSAAAPTSHCGGIESRDSSRDRPASNSGPGEGGISFTKVIRGDWI